ncbi:hypothetical protein CDV31_000308 [Fusarium ambrosium]|uniref:Uncharacterized protein n=1 Tax=Fusarium ambrosium TaxID=131363 RepID=A0A428V349_9HYPO|nr:hypothetical protein CDV31_000308 [Fusarium ambrosium]
MLQSALYRLTPRSPNTLLSTATKTRQISLYRLKPVCLRELILSSITSSSSSCLLTTTKMMMSTTDLVATGWSLGQYYPGRRLEDWTDVSNSAAPVVNSNNRGEHGTSSRSTSGSTSHTTHDTTTASKARQPSEQTGGSEDSEKSKEGKKAKPKSFCKHPEKK